MKMFKDWQEIIQKLRVEIKIKTKKFVGQDVFTALMIDEQLWYVKKEITQFKKYKKES